MKNPVLIHEVHDTWPATLHEVGRMSKSNPFYIVMQISENSAYKNSDYVVSLPPLAEKYMIKHGLKQGAFVHIPNGIVEEEKKTEGRDDTIFLPKIPKTSIPTLMENIDCCYVGALHNDMFRFGICMNKFFDSMMSGKPILYAVEAPNNFIEDYQCGISVKAEDTDALVDGMKKMIELTAEERTKMGRNGRAAVLEHFTYEKLAKQFEELF